MSVRPQSLQSCLTLCNPMDCSPPGSSVHGILQARILEWVAMPSSRGSSQPRERTRISCLLHWQEESLPLAVLGSPTIPDTSPGLNKTELLILLKFFYCIKARKNRYKHHPIGLFYVVSNQKFNSNQIEQKVKLAHTTEKTLLAFI